MRTILFASLLLVASSLGAQERQWFVVDIAGAPVGWMRESRTVASEGVRTEGAMYMALDRLGSKVVIESSQAWRETATGRLIALDLSNRMSEQAVKARVTIDGKRATLTVDAGGRAFDRTVELNDPLVGPEGARLATLRGLITVGDSIQYATWDGQLNAPATVTRVLVAMDSLRQVTERSSAMPVVTTFWLDSAGRPVRSQLDLPFGRTTAVRADSATAMAAAADGGTLAEESYERTLVRTPIRLPRAREIERLTLALEVTDSSLAMPDLAGPGQRVISRDGSRTVIEVSRRRPSARATLPVTPAPELREYLEPNAYVQSDEPRLVALAKEVVGTERDVLSASLALERWVAENMKFDLGVAFATSREVFERRRGTCVAYATILAALTRAVGIPSRIAMGYVYVNGAFGGHAWTEVLVASEWIPIDAAVVADGPADAARFAFAWSSLAGGPGTLTSGAATQLYGRLRASVEAFELAGTRRVVPAKAASYTIEGDRYVNEWLGIEVVKPAGFQFTRLDETWPSDVVVAYEKGSERVRVLSRARRPWSAVLRSETEIPNGLERWVIEVESANPAALLEKARAGIRFAVRQGSEPPGVRSPRAADGSFRTARAATLCYGRCRTGSTAAYGAVRRRIVAAAGHQVEWVGIGRPIQAMKRS